MAAMIQNCEFPLLLLSRLDVYNMCGLLRLSWNTARIIYSARTYTWRALLSGIVHILPSCHRLWGTDSISLTYHLPFVVKILVHPFCFFRKKKSLHLFEALMLRDRTSRWSLLSGWYHTLRAGCRLPCLRYYEHAQKPKMLPIQPEINWPDRHWVPVRFIYCKIFIE